MHIWKWLVLVCMVLILGSSCASTKSSAEMSAKDEARYKAAIEKADQENPPPIQMGEKVVVNMSGSSDMEAMAMAEAESGLAEPAPGVKRDFEVSRESYESFFNQSPAVVLGRMVLEPIHDGTSLLGYRIKSLNQPFEAVDLQDEDIIVGLGGKVPRTPDDYFTQWQTCKTALKCVVNIQRGVDRFDLTWIAK